MQTDLENFLNKVKSKNPCHVAIYLFQLFMEKKKIQHNSRPDHEEGNERYIVELFRDCQDADFDNKPDYGGNKYGSEKFSKVKTVMAKGDVLACRSIG